MFKSKNKYCLEFHSIICTIKIKKKSKSFSITMLRQIKLYNCYFCCEMISHIISWYKEGINRGFFSNTLNKYNSNNNLIRVKDFSIVYNLYTYKHIYTFIFNRDCEKGSRWAKYREKKLLQLNKKNFRTHTENLIKLSRKIKKL